jgi:hypothetical protein
MTTELPAVAVASVSLLDVYTRQVEMGAQLAVIHEQLKAIPDHELRIRALESARARIWGAAITLGAIAGGGASWIALAVSHR